MASQASSPLTSLLTISTPASYFTARDSPTDEADGADDTGISSPVEAQPEPRYRAAKNLPRELSDHCRILLEDGLYCSTLNILNSLLSAGSSPSLDGIHEPMAAYVTPWRELALLANLAVHPSHTSRPSDESQARVASCALGHLRSVLATVGPVNARLHKAFTFRRGGGRRGKDSGGSDAESIGGGNYDGDTSSDDASIESRLAQEQSVWRRAPDIWAVVGWAFRCARLHPHRWKFWKVWLEFMLDVLEADWEERQQLDDDRWDSLASSPVLAGPTAAQEVGKMEGRHPHLKESLFMSYLDAVQKERKSTLNEAQRAVFAFADESQRDDMYYKEVFPRETALAEKSAKRKRTHTLDLAKGQFGDYLDHDDEHGAMDCENEYGSPSRSSRRRERKSNNSERPFLMSDATMETIPIRLRLFALLSKASYYLAGLCPFDLDDLYEKFADSVRALPLPMFKEFVCSHRTPLRTDAYVKLSRRILEGLMLSSTPKHLRPERIDPANDARDCVTVLMLQKCYLPFAAHMVYAVQNAMLSMTLENLLTLLWTDGIPSDQNTPELWDAVRLGIYARQEKCRPKKGDPAGQDSAREALERSAANLEMLVDLLKAGDVDDCVQVMLNA